MAAPWTTSIKDIGRSGHTQHPNAAAGAGFSPPATIVRVSTGPQALFAAMAKMLALKTASPALVPALTSAASALTEAVVDDAGNAFDLVADAEQLEESAQGWLATSLGVGFCHLAMMAFGYVWNDHARNLIKTSGALADFAYDGGPAAGHGIVLAEAKGSVAASASASKIQSDTDGKYRQQVDPHIGAGTQAGSVIHGYAIGFAVQPESVRRATPPPHAFLHVAETTPVPATPVSAGGGAGGVNTLLALGNYRADFLLAGASHVVEAIDALRAGRRDIEDAQEFRRIAAGGRTFLAGAAVELGRARGTFGVDEEVAQVFLTELTRMVREGWHPETRLELPIIAPRLDPGEPITAFADGLVALQAGEESGLVAWSPREGWLRRTAFA